jgi:hypothetical protein
MFYRLFLLFITCTAFVCTPIQQPQARSTPNQAHYVFHRCGAHYFFRRLLLIQVAAACHLPGYCSFFIFLLLTMTILSVLFFFSQLFVLAGRSQRRRVHTAGEGVGIRRFSRCFWYFSADLGYIVETVSAVPGCSCH